MGKVRLREATDTGANSNGSTPVQSIPLKPLQVSGIVVRKPDLLEALRVYVPGLVDIQVTEDGEHYWLLLSQGGSADDPAAT